MSRSGRLAMLLVVGFALPLAMPVSAAANSPQFSLSEGVTFNNNITLLASDVNFGPAALARDDVIGQLRLDSYFHEGQTRFHAAVTRADFLRNGDLDYLDLYFRGSWEVPGKGASYYRASVDYNKFDPDTHVQPDPVTGFPFTTTEVPNRRVYNLVLNQELDASDQLQLQGVDQSLWYENNPVLDNSATGGVARYSRLFSKVTTAFVEAGTNTKHYQNIAGPGVGFLRTPQDHQGVGISFVPSARFGAVMKYNRVEQQANIPDFVLDQWDLSTIVAYTPERGASVVMTAQKSRRAFPFRAVGNGEAQDDHELLANLQFSQRIGRRQRGILTLTYDRNRSNNTEFDYVNRIAAVEVRHSF